MSEFGNAFPVHAFEEAAECGKVLKSQYFTDFLRTFLCVEQQAACFRIHPFVDDPQGSLQSVESKEVKCPRT